MDTKNQKIISLNKKSIAFLTHLEHINSCLSNDAYGEARYELHKLGTCIKSDDNLKTDTKAMALSLCDMACTNMIRRDTEKVIPCILSLNQMALKAAIYYLQESTIRRSTSKEAMTA